VFCHVCYVGRLCDKKMSPSVDKYKPLCMHLHLHSCTSITAPYGIREGAKKIDAIPGIAIPEHRKHEGGHIAQRTDYHLSDVYTDLLGFAARFLALGGRLVAWFPVNLATYVISPYVTSHCHATIDCQVSSVSRAKLAVPKLRC